MKHCVVTVATLSHLPYARVLMNSVASHNGDLDRFVLIVDGAGIETDLFRSVTPDEIGEPLFREILGPYTASERCFAYKPFVLRWLIEEGYQTAQYLDSDICTYQSLEGFVSRLGQHSIVLTPHRVSNAPTLMEDLELHLAGTYNAGYLAVSNSIEAREFLDWWSERTSALCYNQPELGVCGDQRWLDGVPVRYPSAYVERSLQANVGHWNLDERPIEWDGSRYFVHGEPLEFFHFSGLDPAQSRMLSTHSDKIMEGELARLVAEYIADLQSQGLDTRSSDDGNRLMQSLRRLRIRRRLKRERR